MSACKCDFRTRMVGDGCDVCNPAKALEYARETIDEQESEIERLNSCLRYEQNRADRVGTHGPGCETWGPAHYECVVLELAASREREARMRCALRNLLALDVDHQRGADDEDVCAEVREARAALAEGAQG